MNLASGAKLVDVWSRRRRGRRARVAFLVETGLGHRTYVDNLRKAVDAAPDLHATWIHADTFLDELGKYGVDYCETLARRAAYELEARTLGGRPFDALFFHTPPTAVRSLKFIRRTPTVVSLDCTPRQYRAMAIEYGGAAERSAKAWRTDEACRAVMHACHSFIAFSGWAARSVVEDYGGAPEKARVWYPAPPLTTWAASERQYGSGGLRMLFVGGHFWRKGGDLLRRWMREEAPPGCHLDVVSGDNLPSFGSNVTVHRSLRPNDPKLVQLFQRAHVLVLPTRADCSAWVCTEAFAAGLPVLSTRVGGIPEIVGDVDDPDAAGLLIEPSSYPALSSMLGRLARDPSLLAPYAARARGRMERLCAGAYERIVDVIREAIRSGEDARPMNTSETNA